MRSIACLALLAALLGGAASAADAPTLAISATGVLGDDDTIVIAVSNPSTRVEITVPEGYAFPRPAPTAGHAFIRYAGGTGERGVVSVLAAPPQAPCAAGAQAWNLGFTSANIFAFVSGQVMTICGLPRNTIEIVLASKYWSTPQSAGDYVWLATTADGANARTTIRLPVRLTLAQTKRRPVATLRARLSENGLPIPRKLVQLVVPGRAPLAARTSANGTAHFTLRIRRKTVVYAETSLGEQASEAHTLLSKRLVLRP